MNLDRIDEIIAKNITITDKRLYEGVFNAVLEAVNEENEACAAIAEKELGNTAMLTSMPPKSSAAWNILFAIRARSDK